MKKKYITPSIKLLEIGNLMDSIPVQSGPENEHDPSDSNAREMMEFFDDLNESIVWE
jgi:hypothetical protein